MVYCATFYCNANSSKTKVTCSWSEFPMEPTFCKRQADEAQPDVFASRKLVSASIRTILFPVVEAMLTPPIRRTSTTTVHLGSKRAVSADTGDVGSR